MKKLLTLSLTLVALVAFTGLGAVQESKAQQKSPPAGWPLPGVSQKDCHGIGGVVWQLSDGTFLCILKGIKLMTSKVTQADEKAKTFTVMLKSKELTFNAADLESLPRVGDIVDVSTSPAGIMVCHLNGAGDMACCMYGDDCFVYQHL